MTASALEQKTRVKVCIASFDLVGPIRNGGIGTAYTSLAIALASAGFDVTVLFGLGAYCEQETIAHWRRYYRARGIRFVRVPQPAIEIKGSTAVCASYAVYLWLKDRQFDIVHFHEWRGIGYYSLLAQKQGLALTNAVTCVGAHSPSFWHKEGMRETPTTVAEVETDFMERESMRLADVVWFPSRHMAEWTASHGWPAPARSFVHQYVMLDRPAASGATNAKTSPDAISELVFFGRLETRKGLDLFCDALDRVAARGKSPERVTFMGKIASVDGVDSKTYLEHRSAKWGELRWRVESALDRDAALAYLRQPGRLAVLPSRVDNLPYTVLECLGAQIPFVSSNVGGIPEMVSARDRRRVLFSLDPNECADVIERALESGMSPARPAIAFDETISGWVKWHRVTAAKGRRLSRRAARQPKVTVCVTHRNRPHFLERALASIAKQDYPNVDLVIVDDGSDDPKTIAYLRKLEQRAVRRGWTLIRQPNRYPGAARNAGARVARGEYLLFMDDDNVAKPNEVSTLVRAALSSGAEITTCFLDVFQGSGRPGKALHRWSFLGPSTAVGASQNCFGDTNCLIARRTFERLGGFTEDFGVGFEDWELLAKAALAGCRMTVVPEALVWYRQTGSGVNTTTAYEKNQMRALRPYLDGLPPEHRNLLIVAKRASLGMNGEGRAPEPLPMNHVRNVVVFGAGAGGQLAIELAESCGWSVPYLIDNNQSLWETTAHGRPVKSPSALASRDFDLILVASQAGRAPLFDQLNRMGFAYGANYAYFLDPVSVGSVQHRVVL